MDHFNSTVQKDGALVSTRRGLQVTKHKYHGISFVNSSGPAQPTGGSVGTSGKKKKSSKPKAASSFPSSSSFSSLNSTPAPSGFSTFSAYSPPPAATPSSNHEPSNDNSSNSNGNNNGNNNGNRTGASQKSTARADPSKPLVHRWKLDTKPAGPKAKRERTVTGSSQKQHPGPSDRRPSPAASDASSMIITASTPAASSTASFPSPFLASPSSVADSTISSSVGSLSPSSTSPLESLFSRDWEAEYISPSAAALRTSNKRNRTAKSDRSTESKARKARINALASSCQQVTRSLPTWTMCHIPQLNKFEQRLFHQFFQLIPRKLYPFEDLLQYNPTRSSEFYWMVVQDRAAVRCVLLCGAMFRAMLSGANNSEELAQEVSNVCRIVNQQLSLHQKEGKRQPRKDHDGDDDGSSSDGGHKMQLAAHVKTPPPPSPLLPPQVRRVIPEMTLECITTLALMGGSTGRYDHWHLHMQALSKMVELNGGRRFVAEVRPALLFKMRKTDLKGAMALAIRPYLPFETRAFPNISDSVLLDVTRQDIAASAAALFTDPACGIAPAVTQTLGALCVFVQAVQLAADLAKTAAPLPLDPYCFSEELYWLQFHLVSQPGPLRQDVAPQDTAAAHDAETAALRHTGLQQPTPRPNTLLPVDTSRLETESYVRNHRAPLAALYIVPAAFTPPGTTVLEPAMRICGILYLKEYFPDFPRNLGGYAILLHLLRCHLGGDNNDGGGSITPTLLANRQARALLLWMCLVGDTVSRLANGNEQRYNMAEQYDRRVFRDRLVDLVRTSGVVEGGDDTIMTSSSQDGIMGMDGIDGMVGADGMVSVDRLPDSDWALCRLLDLGKFQQQGEWNDRQGVLNILLEGAF